MSAISDRFLLLLMTAVGFGSILVAWVGGYVEAEGSSIPDEVIYGALVLLLLAIMVGAYFEFRHLDKEASS